MSRIYISGPIKNNPNYYQMFEKREQALIELGYQVCNPVKLCEDLKKSTYKNLLESDYLKYDLSKLLNCDGITFLEGAEKSDGSKLERLVAEKCGIPTVSVKIF